MISPEHKWKIATLILASIMLVAASALFIASPGLCLMRMSAAAQNKDASTFVSYIDFPKLRENLKADLNAQMLANMSKSPDTGFAALLGPTIINNMIDAYVTPAAAERMMAGDMKVNPSGSGDRLTFSPPTEGAWEFAYTGINEFRVISNNRGEKIAFTLERSNLIFWKLVRVQHGGWKY